MSEDLRLMKKFAVKVDLSEFFNDERKMTVILVDPEWKNVESLQQKLQNLFGLEPTMHFTTVEGAVEGCYIPLQEAVEVLRFTTMVKCYLPSTTESSKKKEKGNLKRTISHTEEHDNTNCISKDIRRKKKQKQGHVDATFSTPVKSLKNSDAKKNHIHFEENSEENITNNKPKEPNALVMFHCELEEQSKSQARVFIIQKDMSEGETGIVNDATSQIMLSDKSIDNSASSDCVEQKMPEIKLSGNICHKTNKNKIELNTKGKT